MSEQYLIRRATVKDANILGVVGPAAYAAAYAYLWDDPKAFTGHLESYGPEAMCALIAAEDVCVWLAEFDGTPAGFLTMHLESNEPIASRPQGAELRRIYLSPVATGAGVGRALLSAAEEEAKKRGVQYVWLDAMDSADKAKAAYQKWGFSEIGRSRFPKPLKPGYGDMRVMVKTL